MTLGSRLLKFFKWLLVPVFVFPAAAYLVLLAVNWNDRPPSEAALKFQRIIDSRPVVPDSDNAFVYASGFAIARNLDPEEWGRKRIDWIAANVANPAENDYDNPPGEYTRFREERNQRILDLVDTCGKRVGEACHKALLNGEAVLENWLAQEEWLLDRYRALISRSGWREAIAADIAAPLAPYSEILEGQRLLLVLAWKLAGDGDAAGVRTLLQEDLRFWRKVLVNADTLISKMIATAAMGRHFAWSNLVLRRLPDAVAAKAIPDSWQQSVSEQELSLERCLAGEWTYMNHMVFELVARPHSLRDLLPGDGGAELVSRLTWKMESFLLQPQDTSNRYAETLLAASEVARMPLGEFPQALEDAEQVGRNLDEPNFEFYNPVGAVLARVASPSYTSYSAQVADLEGARRAALLTAQLRPATAPARIQQRLNQSGLRNPYTGEPFAWDEESGAIVFTGLASGERGRHAFLY